MSFNKYELIETKFFRRYNSPRNLIYDFYEFYKDFPESQVFKPEQFGMTYMDVSNCIYSFSSKMVALDSKMWKTGDLDDLIWDRYLREKLHIENKWICPTVFVYILLCITWIILILTGSGDLGWLFWIGLPFIIFQLIVYYFIAIYVLQFIIVLIHNLIIGYKKDKIIKRFKTNEIYTIIKAQDRYKSKMKDIEDKSKVVVPFDF